MAFAAGALSKTLVGQSFANLSSAVATGGIGPYTYQWYRSTTSGFSPGAGSLLSGQTALTLADSGLIPGTQYYYLVVATDTGNSNVTVNSSQLSVLTEPSQSPNQFAQTPLIGVVDMKVGTTNIMSAIVDSSAANPIFPGQAVKIVSNTSGGVPRVVPVAAKADAAIGIAIFNIKDLVYNIGQSLEIALWGTVIWQYATGAISQFAEVCLDTTYVGGVQATGSTATALGWALDGAGSSGGLVRVMLMPNISFATA